MKHLRPKPVIPPLTLGIVRQVKAETGMDLLRAGDPEQSGRLWTDPVLAGRIIAVAGGPELGGDALAEATNDLADALIQFFPKRSIYDDFIQEQDKPEPGEVDPWRVVFRAAGLVKLDPWPYSFRELVWMAQGAFEPYAAMIADVKNARRQKKSDPIVDVDTLNPWHPKRPRPKRTRSQNARTRQD